MKIFFLQILLLVFLSSKAQKSQSSGKIVAYTDLFPNHDDTLWKCYKYTNDSTLIITEYYQKLSGHEVFKLNIDTFLIHADGWEKIFDGHKYMFLNENSFKQRIPIIERTKYYDQLNTKLRYTPQKEINVENKIFWLYKVDILNAEVIVEDSYFTIFNPTLGFIKKYSYDYIFIMSNYINLNSFLQ